LAARVRRPSEYDDIFNDLREKGIFPTYKDMMVFAAALGFRRGNRKAFQKSSEPIDIEIFRGDFDRTIISVIAVEETEDPRMIAPSREDERIRIFEEYANGGFDILRREIYEGKQNWPEGILSLVQKEKDHRSMLDDITELAKFS
jgi:dnd system-associated protein 4